MINMEEARDILDSVITELKNDRMVIIAIPGEETLLNCVDARICMKSIIKEKHLPILVLPTVLPVREESRMCISFALVFFRTRQLSL